MPKLPSLNTKDAIRLIEENGFIFSRQSGSHTQYYRDGVRVTIPVHDNKSLHPKIVKQILIAIGQI